MAPILISGATGTLGRAFATICQQRNIACRVLDRTAMDIADPKSVAAAIARWNPWAIVNTSGYARIEMPKPTRSAAFARTRSAPACSP